MVKCRKNCTQTHLRIQCIIDTGDYVTTTDSWSVDEMTRLNHTNLMCHLNETESDSLLINIVSYFLKGSTFLNKFNKMITSLVNTGLIIKADSGRKKKPCHSLYWRYWYTRWVIRIHTVPLPGRLSRTAGVFNGWPVEIFAVACQLFWKNNYKCDELKVISIMPAGH